MSTDNNIIGNNIKRIRNAQNLTQKQLGELCHMPDSAIRKYESGRQKPKYETLQRLASALNCSVDYLCTDEKVIKKYIRLLQDTTGVFQGAHYATLPLNFSLENVRELGKMEEQKILWIEQMTELYTLLSDSGKQVALERVKELTYIPDYQKKE